MKEEYNNQTTYSTPSTDPNILKYRLDTSEIMWQLEQFLRNEITVSMTTPSGDTIQTNKSVGLPRANPQGIAALLNWVRGTVNSTTVQGNFYVDHKTGVSQMYLSYITEYHKDLALLIFANLYTYEIEESEAEGLIDFIMELVQPFFTRLIGNKERDSYNQSMQNNETTVTRDKTGLPLFKK